MSIAFVNATVLTLDASATVHAGCDVVVRDGRIAALGPGAAAGAGVHRTIDAGRLVLLPGLVNAHTHSPENLSKGRDEASLLDQWFARAWGDIEDLPPRAIHVAALLGVGQMLRSGATALLDHFRQTPMNAAALDAAIAAYATAGVRAIVAPMLRDRVVPAGRSMPPVADQIALIESAATAGSGRNPRVRVGYGPSAPHRCTDALLAAVAEAAARTGAPVHCHVDESRIEAERARDLYGESSVRHLARRGLLGPHLSIAHAVHVDADDIETLAGSGTVVVHNPVSNMRLASGIAPIVAMRDAGVNLAIGTDGAASNDGQNVFEALKTALTLQRLSDAPPARWLTAREGLRAAANRAAFGLGAGRIEVGLPADLVAISTASYALTPVNDWHRQIVFGAPDLNVRHAMVDGTLLLDDGVITTFDESAVLAEAHSIAARLFGGR